jgi:hypothetical protein
MGLLNLARMSVSGTPGTASPITLGSAVTGYKTANDAGALNGRYYTYSIREGNLRELCRGVYTTSGTTITRETIISTNATATNPESFTSAAIVSFVAEASDVFGAPDPLFGDAGNPVMGVPGMAKQGIFNVNPFTGQRIWYSPFIVRRRTKFIGVTFVVGGTAASSPTYRAGLYKWDKATGKPTTLLGEVSQAVTITTTYNKDFAAPIICEPGQYCSAFLANQTGIQSVLQNSSMEFEGDNSFRVNSNLFQHPQVYGSATGKTTLPNPETVAPTPFQDTQGTALGLGGGWFHLFLYRYQDA